MKNKTQEHSDVSEAKHTPLPWKSLGEIILTDDGKNVEIGTTRYLPSENSHANAAFIVKAVNAHEELVEMLHNMLKAFGEHLGTHEKMVVLGIIAKAKGMTVAELSGLAKAEASSATRGGK